MKKVLLLIFPILFTLNFSFAQNRSTLRLRLSDGSLLKVAINNREFKKISSSLIIGDVPGKRPHIKVYRFRPYADGRGGKAEIVYSGTIKIQKGGSYDGIIDLNNRRLLLKEVNSLENIPESAPFKIGNDKTLSEPAGSDESSEINSDLSPELMTIKKAMDQEVSDHEKLNTVERYIGSSILTHDVAHISSWFFFDETKIKFIKMIYPKVADRENLSSLESIFTSEVSKNEFRNFLKKQ